MPFLSESPESPSPIRLLCMGESGMGKTGSLLSLAEAGFILHILDLEAKAEALFRTLLHGNPRAQNILSRIDIEVASEQISFAKDKPKVSKPAAFERAGEILGQWGDQRFGPSHVLVVDSFSKLSEYAGNAIAKLKGHEPVFQDYPEIFARLNPLLDLLTGYDPVLVGTGSQLDCHVIVLTHVNMYEVRQKTGNKTTVGKVSIDETVVVDTKFFPKAIGQALSPKIPTYFNSMLMYGTARNKPGERVIKLLADDMTPIKTPAVQFAKDRKQLSIETGLAEYFRACGAIPPTPAKEQ